MAVTVSVEARPGTANSDRPRTGRSSSSVSEHPSVQEKTVKRTVGVGAIDIGSMAREQSELRTSATLWIPTTPSEDRNDEGAGWDDIIRELGRSPTGGFSRVSAIKRFDVFATALPSLDLDSLIRTTPTLLHNIHTTQKLGFSGVPSKPRSDIYLTITEPLYPRTRNLLTRSSAMCLSASDANLRWQTCSLHSKYAKAEAKEWRIASSRLPTIKDTLHGGPRVSSAAKLGIRPSDFLSLPKMFQAATL